MRVLSETEFAHEADSARRRIFRGNDPYEACFAAHAHKRLILFEYWYEVEHPLLEVLVNSSMTMGETKMYISLLDRPPQHQQLHSYHWCVDFVHVEQYKGLVGPLENVVYSQNGNWAIMASDEHHGLLGCTDLIYGNIIAAIPNIVNEVKAFVGFWKANKKDLGSNVSWLEPLLIGTYGEAYAKTLLRGFSVE